MSGAGRPDIVWIVIDGVRPDRLQSCGNRQRSRLFIDEVLSRGALFDCVIAAGTNSKTSMHSAFASLNPAVHRMRAYDPELQVDFDPQAVTITDLLRANGYTTFRYLDAVQYESCYDVQQVVPAGGFHVWESGGYALLRDTPQHSFATPQRSAFVERFNGCPGPKFAYLHLLTSHEIYPERVTDCTWTSEIYEQGLHEVSDDFERLWSSLDLEPNCIVALATDHGVRLDCHLVHDLVKNGINLRDQSCRTFCSFIAPGITPAGIGRMVRNLDIAPTLLELAGCGPMPGQGVSLVPLIRGEELPPLHAFTEGVGSYEIPEGEPRVANIWGVRTERWKFWTHATRGDSLFDLQQDPQERENLAGRGLAVEQELRRLVRDELIERPRSPEQLYREQAQRLGRKLFSRREIVPEVSILLLCRDETPFLAETVRAIRGQLAVYWELCLVRYQAQSRPPASELPEDFRVTSREVGSADALRDLVTQLRGEHLLILNEGCVLHPIALYRIRELLQQAPGVTTLGCDAAWALRLFGRPRLFPLSQRGAGGHEGEALLLCGGPAARDQLALRVGRRGIAIGVKGSAPTPLLAGGVEVPATLYLHPPAPRRLLLTARFALRAVPGILAGAANRLRALFN